MQSVQESKQELEAAVRYAENAISSAKQTIESMEFRQQMAQKNYQEQTGREEALQREVNELTDVINRMDDDATGDSVTIKQLNDKIDELKSEGARLAERIDEMKDAAFADGKTIEHLKDKVQGQYDDIKMLERDITVKEAQAGAWKKKYYDFKEALVKAGDPRVVEGVSGVIMNKPTMPVIPKGVAIAIFREGVQHGVEAACTELDNAADISIEETEYAGDFEVSFSKYIDLSDHVDTDWMRGKCGDYSEEGVVDALKGLCADKEFECRIHGIDDQEEKKND